MFMLAAHRVVQHFVSASEEASLLVGETVSVPGEGDAGYEDVHVSAAQVYKCHLAKLTTREQGKYSSRQICSSRLSPVGATQGSLHPPCGLRRRQDACMGNLLSA